MLMIRHISLVYLYLAAQLATIANSFLHWHYSAKYYSRHIIAAADRFGPVSVLRDANLRDQTSTLARTSDPTTSCVQSENIYI